MLHARLTFGILAAAFYIYLQPGMDQISGLEGLSSVFSAMEAAAGAPTVTEIIAVSPSSPIQLWTGLATVRLAWQQAPAKLSHLLSSLDGKRAYLILEGIGAEAPPNVLYHVYLNMGDQPRTGADSQREHQVGVINFFDAVTQGHPITRSFDVTSIFEKRRDIKVDNEHLTVSISSSAPPDPNSEPTVARVRIVIE